MRLLRLSYLHGQEGSGGGTLLKVAVTVPAVVRIALAALDGLSRRGHGLRDADELRIAIN